MRKYQLSATCILLATGIMQAQYAGHDPLLPYDPANNLSQEADGMKSDSDSLPNLTVIQPSALAARLELHRNAAPEAGERSVQTDSLPASEAGERHRINGFRVQVFSDNNQRTSQQEAKAKERKINERFPEYETYIVYNSPYWRLKVGDFRTEFDAESAADEIKRAFPEFAREVRIVRDRISVAR